MLSNYSLTQIQLRAGTVISIHPNLNLKCTSPIEERLHRPDSVLRTSEDASLLVQSLLDLGARIVSFKYILC
jgi:hypothetical protein